MNKDTKKKLILKAMLYDGFDVIKVLVDADGNYRIERFTTRQQITKTINYKLLTK